MSNFREYLFEYDHDGATWGIVIKAANADDARARMSRMSLARFCGEGIVSVPVPLGGLWERLFARRKAGSDNPNGTESK